MATDADPWAAPPDGDALCTARAAAFAGRAWASELARRAAVRASAESVAAAHAGSQGCARGPGEAASVSGASVRRLLRVGPRDADSGLSRWSGCGDADDGTGGGGDRECRDASDGERRALDCDDGDFMVRHRALRLAALRAAACAGPSWDAVATLAVAADLPAFADDAQHSGVAVLVLLWDACVPACAPLRDSWAALARARPPGVHLAEMRATAATRHFDVDGLPALAAYREGVCVGAWVRLQDEGCRGDALAVAQWLARQGLVSPAAARAWGQALARSSGGCE